LRKAASEVTTWLNGLIYRKYAKAWH
jgi:hypothetical protein